MKLATNKWYSIDNHNIKLSSQTEGYTGKFEDVKIKEDKVIINNTEYNKEDLKLN